MKRVLRLALVPILAVAGLLVAPTPVIGPDPAAGAAFVDLGNDDTLVFLTPWETAWLASVLENNFQWNCAPPGLPVPRVVKFFNKLCSGYSAYSRVSYWRVKTFLKFAVLNGGCGAFVLDGASWRPTRARPATVYTTALSSGEVAHTWTRFGESSWFKTSDGWTKVRCSEYRHPDRQSNILPTGPSRVDLGS